MPLYRPILLPLAADPVRFRSVLSSGYSTARVVSGKRLEFSMNTLRIPMANTSSDKKGHYDHPLA